MDYNGFNSFEEMLRACGFTDINKNYNNASSYDKTTQDGNFQNSDKTTSDGNAQWNEYFGFDTDCMDIPGGFQKMYPQLFAVMGQIIGNIVAGNLPINVQNSFGNWLQLVGQVILTYNAQQQYFQGGPGRYFDPKYYNVSNPFCRKNSYSGGISNFEDDDIDNMAYNNKKKKYNKKAKITREEINDLKKYINELSSEIYKMKTEIEGIKNLKQE